MLCHPRDHLWISVKTMVAADLSASPLALWIKAYFVALPKTRSFFLLSAFFSYWGSLSWQIVRKLKQ